MLPIKTLCAYLRSEPKHSHRRRRTRRHAQPAEVLEDRALLSIHSVLNTSDSGVGSLRQAILDANAASEAAQIVFEIPASDAGFVDVDSTITGGDVEADVFRIQPLSTLPAVNNALGMAVTIDATSQHDTTGETNAFGPEIELDGSLAGAGVHGLVLDSDHLTVRGFTINNFDIMGVLVRGDSTTIAGNYIGTDSTGTMAQPNRVIAGIEVFGASSITIGGPDSADGNLISGNGSFGVLIQAASSQVMMAGNLIGTDRTGTSPLGNIGGGIRISAASDIHIGAGNVVSGNSNEGLWLNNVSNVTVTGSKFGSTADGTAALPNGNDGIHVDGGSMNVVIGGSTPAERNIISGNNGSGVEFRESTTSGNQLLGNFIGTDVTGTIAIGNADGIEIEGALNTTIGGSATGAGNLISGNRGDGVTIFGSTATGNRILGNRIGTNVTGTADLGNQSDGVQINGTSGNSVGGSNSGEGNVISGNDSDGLDIFNGATDVTISGNLIGTNLSGTEAIPNTGHGISVENTSNISIGSSVASDGNVISGNARSGVAIGAGADRTTVAGNLIGTDATGMSAVPNANSGIWVGVHNDATNTTIGGTNAGAKNVISGNGLNGIGAGGNGVVGLTILNNYIGLNAAGDAAVPNSGMGMRLEGGVSNITIGSPGAGNVISGNESLGIGDTFVEDITIQSNIIGLDALGTFAIGNHVDGISFSDARNILIGGADPTERNIISGNAHASQNSGHGGIFVRGSNITISGNYVGTDITGTADLGNLGPGIRANVTDTLNVSNNLVSGNGQSGIVVWGDASGAASIRDNLVGTSNSGTSLLPNDRPGIWLQQASNVDVTDNVSVSSTSSSGLIIDNSRDITASGNKLGVLTDGVTAAPNNAFGLDVYRSYDLNINDNTISGNRLTGVRVQESMFEPTLVQWAAADGGNDHWYWLTPDRRTWDSHEALAVSLGAHLVTVNSAEENTFVASTLVSQTNNGAAWHGINDAATEGSFVWSSGEPVTFTNWGGIEPNGGTRENYGHFYADGTWNDVPGYFQNYAVVEFTSEPNPADLIAAYGDIEFTGNRIGVGADGTTAIPNADGFDISDSANVIIGGSTAGDANIIAHNTNDGVHIRREANVTVTGNSIHSNGREGIDLSPQGPTANDPLDADVGPNGLQNFPVLDDVTFTNASATISGTLHSTPNSAFEIEVFSNSATSAADAEGETLVGEMSVTTDSNGDAVFSLVTSSTLPPNLFLTATATDSSGNTSEFSNAFLAAAELSLSIDATTIAEDGSATATVSRNTDTTSDLDVMILVDDTSEITAPVFVTIPAGSGSATFAVNGVQDFRIDGTKTATVSVMADGLMSADAVIDVTDIDVAEVVVTQNPAGVQVYEGADISESPVITQDWGVNLNQNVDWATMGAWVDQTKQFRRWGKVDAPWQEETWTQPFTNQGIPQEDFGTIVANSNGGIPIGHYQLRYSGTAAVTAHGGWRVNSSQSSGGTATVNIEVTHHVNSWLKFRGVSAADPVRDIKMVAAGTDINTTQTFGDSFLKRLQPFSTLRFMDWNETNNSEVTAWADRRPAQHTIQTGAAGTAGGVAWEYMIQLANETQKDAWINVPHLADDNYVRELAKLWRDNLDPNLTLYVEWSNESWNGIFDQFEGPDLDGDGNARDGHDYYLAGNAGPQTVRVSNIFREEFGHQSNRLHVTLAGQSANDWVAGRGLKYMTDNGLVPSDVIDSVSIAPYFGIPNNSTATTADELFAELHQRTSDIQEHAALANLHGLDLIAYEGGQHLAPNIHTNVPREVLDAAQDDPRMGDAYRDFAAIWEANGGGLFNHFAHTQADANSGYWSLLDHINNAGNVKWDAALSIIQTPGDASLDGAVTATDFAILSTNFGQSGMWWEQGDFNGDRTVDGTDLQLLYANGQFSAAETAEVMAFAEANSVPLFDGYTVALSSIPEAPVTVTIGTDDQLTTSAVEVTFAADETALVPQTVYVAATNDSLLEGGHSSNIEHQTSSADAAYNSLLVDDVPAAIIDDEVGTLSVEATADAHEDGIRNGQFVVRIDQAATVDVDVTYSISGSASAGSDYDTLPGTVTILAGHTSANIDVAVIDDNFAESVETVSLQIDDTSLGRNAVVDPDAATDKVSIFSDDLNVIRVSHSTVTVAEDGTTATFSVTLGAEPSASVVVDVASLDTGEAMVSGTTLAAGLLTFTPANWNVPQTITVTGVDDADVDGNQHVDVRLSIDVAASASEFRFTPAELVDVLNTDNDKASATAGIEDITFYNKNATLEDGLSPEKTGQRSIIKHVQIVLDDAVTFTAATVSSRTFVVKNLTTATEVGVAVDSVTFSGGRTTVVLSFVNGPSVVGGGLIDGNYELLIDGNDHGFDADRSGTAGGTGRTKFHRLFGDTDGDRDVDNGDFGNLYRAFYGDPAYRSAFDRDDDNDLFDEIGAFFSNYGRFLYP